MKEVDDYSYEAILKNFNQRGHPGIRGEPSVLEVTQH